MPRSLLTIAKDPLIAMFSALVTLPSVYLFVDDIRYFATGLVAHIGWLGLVLIKNRQRKSNVEKIDRESDAESAPDALAISPVASVEERIDVPLTPLDRIMERISASLQALELPSEMEELLSGYFRLAVKALLNLQGLKPTLEIAAGKSEAVQQQVLTVEDIALQTKLLALNDSFEAVGSGESGRGFGMVAREVERVSHSASRVSEAIELEMSAIISTSKQLAEELTPVCFHSLANSYQNDAEIRSWIYQLETASKRLKQQLGRAVTLLSEDKQYTGSFTQNRTDPVVGNVVNQLQQDISILIEALEQINADLLSLHLHPLRLLPDVGRLKSIVEAVVAESALE